MNRFSKITLLLAGSLALVSCSTTKVAPKRPDVPKPATANAIPAAYAPLYAHGWEAFTPQETQTIRSGLPFDSISIRRRVRLGTIPLSEMILHRDGRAELSGQTHLPQRGKYVGEVGLQTYGRLCYLIESSHFSEMNSSYSGKMTEDSVHIITVKSGTTVKEVGDRGRVGPIQLWAIQEVLHGIMRAIDWKEAK